LSPTGLPQKQVTRDFHDNSLLHMLFGPADQHLRHIEQRLGVKLASRGNQVLAAGEPTLVEQALATLDTLYERLQRGLEVGQADVEAALRFETEREGGGPAPVIVTRKRHVQARTPMQAAYMSAMQDFELVFGLGPAGTGKTYLAVAQAVSMMLKGEVDRIVLSRPAVEAGERLGFLPGDLKDKVDPYLRPLYDALYDMLPGDQVAKKLASGEIEVAPLAFMRGRTLANAFVILDEAQNTTPMQMKMFLTRLGEHSRMVITGDLSQIDLPGGTLSGLKEALHVLHGMDDVGRIEFTDRDVVRHHLVARIVRAYDVHDRHGRK
jgi:phosphate starvation-inducible PhoH-like protein